MDEDSERTLAGAEPVRFTDSEATIRDRCQRFRVGDLIMGQYEVLEELGQGGMGVVYRCMDRVSGTEVAVKALPPELSHSADSMEDIRDNFQLVHSLIHQNIAACLTLAMDRSIGDYYLVMEMVSGRSLALWIRRRRREGTLSLEAALPILRQAALALDFAHRKHVMHRDVKPANIIVEDDGTVKVLDFGIAAQIRSTMSRISMAFTEQSGTRQYKAPEQWRSRPQGAATDQYALAVTAYEMLSGRLPFDDDDPAVLREMVLKEEPLPIEGLPDGANNALRRALAKEPAERFASCGDFVQALDGERKTGGSVKRMERAQPSGEEALLNEPPMTKVRIKRMGEALDGGKLDIGQTSGKHLDEFSDKCEAGDAAFDGGLYSDARRFHDEALGFEKAINDAMIFNGVVPLPGGVMLELIKVEQGEFIMGSPSTEEGRGSDKTQHSVYITQDFWLGKYEVTQEQYQAVMGDNPSFFKKGSQYPVESVTWYKAMEFCKKLTEQERRAGRLPDGYEYTLPTEAQWEYAARGGNKSKGYIYSGGYDLDAVGWYDGNSGGWFLNLGQSTHPVGEKTPNELGFRDMSGNVWEWCRDSCVWTWNEGVVTDTCRDGVSDPLCTSGSQRVLRGGSWHGSAMNCRVANRSGSGPDDGINFLGFRVALAPSK